MKTIKSKGKQTVMDIALEQYGTLEAVGEILANNPDLTNEVTTLTRLGIDTVNSSDFYPDVMLDVGQNVLIDSDSNLVRRNVLRQIDREITTFDL